MIDFWAHMLDESFRKMDSERLYPKDENEKFKFGDVFTPDVLENQKKLEEVLGTIWPNWDAYVEDEAYESPDLSVSWDQTAPDDYDVYKISTVDCYGGIENVVQAFLDNLDEIDKNKTYSLKEIVDLALDMTFENALDSISDRKIREYGTRIYKGISWY